MVYKLTALLHFTFFKRLHMKIYFFTNTKRLTKLNKLTRHTTTVSWPTFVKNGDIQRRFYGQLALKVLLRHTTSVQRLTVVKSYVVYFKKRLVFSLLHALCFLFSINFFLILSPCTLPLQAHRTSHHQGSTIVLSPKSTLFPMAYSTFERSSVLPLQSSCHRY